MISQRLSNSNFSMYSCVCAHMLTLSSLLPVFETHHNSLTNGDNSEDVYIDHMALGKMFIYRNDMHSLRGCTVEALTRLLLEVRTMLTGRPRGFPTLFSFFHSLRGFPVFFFFVDVKFSLRLRSTAVVFNFFAAHLSFPCLFM